MSLRVVGAGVGRTGTHSLKLALEQLLGGPCHHMTEVFEHPEQIPVWMDAIDGKPIDWSAHLAGYVALVDWPGASFWPEFAGGQPGRPRTAARSVTRRMVQERVKHHPSGLRMGPARDAALDDVGQTTAP